MDILKRDSLVEGGFAGLKEHRIIKDPVIFGADENKDGSWPGLGNFVYLADARFMPHGETHMHSHNEIDIISLVVDGQIAHQGSLQHGTDLITNDVQVQRAGGEGFSHNEVNPNDNWNRLIQIWLLPEESGLKADYKLYQPAANELTRVYGGSADADFPAKTKVDIAMLSKGQQLNLDEDFMVYITRGKGIANEDAVEDGDMLRGTELNFTANKETQLIVVHTGQVK